MDGYISRSEVCVSTRNHAEGQEEKRGMGEGGMKETFSLASSSPGGRVVGPMAEARAKVAKADSRGIG